MFHSHEFVMRDGDLHLDPLLDLLDDDGDDEVDDDDNNNARAQETKIFFFRLILFYFMNKLKSVFIKWEENDSKSFSNSFTVDH